MTQFAFLSLEFPDLLAHAQKAESSAFSDPRGACFYARLTLETALNWLFRRERAPKRPYGRELAALITEPSLKALTGPAIANKAKYIKDQGNRAAHDAEAAMRLISSQGKALQGAAVSAAPLIACLPHRVFRGVS